MVRFGMIGCGSAAVPVAQAIEESPEARLISVFDTDNSLGKDLAERFNAREASSLIEMLSDNQVEAVYVAVPHDLLQPIALQSLNAGKHVLVEKPMAIRMSQADELVQAAAALDLRLGVYYEMRHVEPVQMARRLVQGAAIGKVLGVRIQTLIDKPFHYWQAGYGGRKISPWRGQRQRAGGGVVLMNTSHLIDVARYITGLDVAAVTGATATLVAPVEVEDSCAAAMVFSNGALGSLLAGAHFAGSRTGDECLDIYGSLGQIRVPDPYGSGSLSVYLREKWNDLAPGIWHTLPSRQIDVHRAAVEEFAHAVEQGVKPSSDGQSASEVLAVVLAIYQSAAEQRMIRIDEVRRIESEIKQRQT